MLAQNISAERHIRMLLLFSHVWLFATPWTASHQASLSFTISWSLLKLTSVELVMPSNHLILFHPLLLSSIFPSTGVFSNESALCIRWPKYRSFRFRTSVLSMNIQGWFPLGIDWFDLLTVQGIQQMRKLRVRAVTYVAQGFIASYQESKARSLICNLKIFKAVRRR